MNKNVKEKLKKVSAYSIVLISVVTLGIIGGNTYAKYFSKINGEGNATVAKWSFKANNETETIANIKLSNTYNVNKLIENKIAPGTSGSFDIVLDATDADVAIDYAVTFDNCKNKPNNLKFSYEEISASTLEELENELKGRINLDDERTKILTINWEWKYETGNNEYEILQNDELDTNDEGKTFTFDIKITGTQVNPSESN